MTCQCGQSLRINQKFCPLCSARVEAKEAWIGALPDALAEATLDPELVFECYRAALRTALEGQINDFGASVAIEAFNECLKLAEERGRLSSAPKLQAPSPFR